MCVHRVGSAHPGAPHVEARVLCILRFYTKQLQVPVKKLLTLPHMYTLVVKYARETCILLYRHTALQVHEENVEFHYGLRPLARPIRGSDPFDAHRSTRNPNRPSSAPRAYSPCRIALYPGRAPFWPPRGARRNLRMRYRLIRAVAKRRAHQSCIDRYGVLGRTVFAPPGWPRARRRKEGAPTRSPTQGQRAVPSGPNG